MPTFDDIWKIVSEWAEQQSAHIISHGRPLTVREIAIAKKVGVRAPDRIRVLVVEAIPFPANSELRNIGTQIGMTAEHTAGMTLDYGIFVRNDQKERPELWPHEFRHVAQYECFGSIKAFMFFYLKEVLHFNYGPGPLEVDARKAEEVA